MKITLMCMSCTYIPLLIFGTVFGVMGVIFTIKNKRQKKENARKKELLLGTEYSKMLIISCYMDTGTWINDSTKRLVHACNEVDDVLFALKFDWIVFYDPSSRDYTVQTMRKIHSQPTNRTLRLSCGCMKRNGALDHRGPYGGKNCFCSAYSNDNIYKLGGCWLKRKDPAPYEGQNSERFIADVTRVLRNSL